MKIAVVAANGRAAQKIVKEAQDRGFEVTAFGRGDENKSGAATYISKDIMDLTKDDLAGFDAVVDGFGAWHRGCPALSVPLGFRSRLGPLPLVRVLPLLLGSQPLGLVLRLSLPYGFHVSLQGRRLLVAHLLTVRASGPQPLSSVCGQ